MYNDSLYSGTNEYGCFYQHCICIRQQTTKCVYWLPAMSRFLCLLLAGGIKYNIKFLSSDIYEHCITMDMWCIYKFQLFYPVNHVLSQLLPLFGHYFFPLQTQWARNKGKCGVCGDPFHKVRDHETGGKYANGIIGREYAEGDVIPVSVLITANHQASNILWSLKYLYITQQF